jgi:hypothetical protein
MGADRYGWRIDTATAQHLVNVIPRRLKWKPAALVLISTFAVCAARAQAPSEDNMRPPSEDNMGVMTEDGFRTTQQPPNAGANGSTESAVGASRPGSGSAAAVAITNELFVGALATAPLVPAAQNLLLGRWHVTGGNLGTDLSSIGPLGSMSSGVLNSGCAQMFGKRVTFGPASFERIESDGHSEVLHVEYHGIGSTIAVLIKGSGTQPTLLRLSDPDHAVSALGCTLLRDQSEEEKRLANNATLRFQVGVTGPGGFTPLANAPLWVMMQDPQAAYRAAGLPLPEGVSLPTKLASDCQSLPVCQGDILATVKGALGLVMTDARGQAQTPPIRPGAYYVVGVSASQGKPLVWVRRINVQPGLNTVDLNQFNANSPR